MACWDFEKDLAELLIALEEVAEDGGPSGQGMRPVVDLLEGGVAGPRGIRPAPISAQQLHRLLQGRGRQAEDMSAPPQRRPQPPRFRPPAGRGGRAGCTCGLLAQGAVGPACHRTGTPQKSRPESRGEPS